ncbi:MAG: hypothetical protein IGS50_08525 [Synechococcales cyanobacterium C42_A2020_086]|jgi:hypothetical protein|nr:hypothetical protein [Synechococcales cyanobacterium C42_A2020_086]
MLRIYLRKTGRLAISTLRQPDALQFVLHQVATGRPQDAKDAFKAMAIHRQDHILWQQVIEAAQARQDHALSGIVEQ